MEKIARDMYDGKLKKSDLSEAHILRTYETLETNTGKGYGKKWLNLNGDLEQSDITTLKMRQNLFKFSMAKDVTMLQELNEAMTPDGKLANWKDFKAAALKLNSKYNVNYLQAEFQTARQACYHAQNWAEYECNKERFPNLEYKTQGDNKVRKSHAELDGVIKPIEDKFWDSAYPPNGWRCRCFVEQTKDTADKGEIKLSKDVKPEFRINTGKGGQVFAEVAEGAGGRPHPYFAIAKDLPIDTLKLYDVIKQNYPLEKVYKTKSGAVVRRSIFADAKDFKSNMKSAKVIADDLDISLDIIADLKESKNPEFFIPKLKLLGDKVNANNSAKSLKNSFKNAFKKLDNGGQLKPFKDVFIVVDLDEVESLISNYFEAVKYTWGILKLRNNLNFLIIEFKGKAIQVNYEDGKFREYLKQWQNLLK